MSIQLELSNLFRMLKECSALDLKAECADWELIIPYNRDYDLKRGYAPAGI